MRRHIVSVIISLLCVAEVVGAVTLTGHLNAEELSRLVAEIQPEETLDLSGVSMENDALPPFSLAGLRAKRLILPASLTSIGRGALMDSRIVEIEIPANVKTIGAYAFTGCRDLNKVTLSQRMTVVADRVFDDCINLSEVILPSSLDSIGSRAFTGCSKLTSLEMPVGLRAICDEAFALTGIREADLSSCAELTSLGRRAFAQCKRLKTAILPSGNVAMGEGLFFGCDSLTSVILPSEAVSMPPLLLTGATGITSLELPAGLTEVGTLAMAGMKGLKEISASALDEVPATGEDIWDGVTQSMVTLRVKQGLESSFENTPQWQEFNINRSELDQIAAELSGGELTAWFQGKKLVVSSDIAIKSITLYAISGSRLGTYSCNGENRVEIDTSNFAGPFFIITADTDTGNTQSVMKLMRPM